MLLQQSSVNALEQLRDLTCQLTEDEYKSPLRVLSGSSIGKHLRHVVEFYECLLDGLLTGSVDYEKRPRNLRLETEPEVAQQAIASLGGRLATLEQDAALTLRMTLGDSALGIAIPTTFYRELAYNIEHCVHHLALVRIGVESSCPHLRLPETFGVAHSTTRHLKNVQ